MHINKMNKTSYSRLSLSTSKPKGMRFIYKNRNNYREKYEVPKVASADLLTKSEDHDVMHHYNSEDVEKMKRFVQSRIKTQYADKYNDNISFERNRSNEFESRPIRTASSFHTPQVNRSSLNNTKTNFKSADDKILIQSESANLFVRKDNLSLQQIEKRIQLLLDKRLQKCVEFKNKSDWILDNELNILIDQLKQIASRDSETEETSLNDLNKKIGMIERLMAENITQSEIIKKQFLSRVSKPQHRRFLTENFSKEVPKLAAELLNHVPVISDSSNHDSFKKPNRQAYNIYKYHNGYINLDKHKQPLPRSSYNREYLNYRGMTPIYAKKPEDNGHFKNNSASKLLTTYRNNFIPKIAEKINYRQLDAWKNKIKNLPVVFGKKQKEEVYAKLVNYLQQNNPKKQQKNIQKMPYPEKLLLTQSRRQFQKSYQQSPSIIKHQNLHKLKYFYKKKLHV